MNESTEVQTLGTSQQSRESFLTDFSHYLILMLSYVSWFSQVNYTQLEIYDRSIHTVYALGVQTFWWRQTRQMPIAQKVEGTSSPEQEKIKAITQRRLLYAHAHGMQLHRNIHSSRIHLKVVVDTNTNRVSLTPPVLTRQTVVHPGIL